jgi:hypothetical protein
MAKFTIEIYSRGFEVGIGAITKEQYDYWAEREDDLGEALNQNIDYDDEDVPENARFEYFYNEYSSEAEAYGPDVDTSTLVIKLDEDEIFNDDFSAFFTEEADTLENISEVESTYIDDLEPGYYVYWEHGGKGLYFEGEFQADTFDAKLLTFKTTIVEGNEVITSVEYNGVEIENFGGDWWGKYADYSLHHIEGE